MLNSMLAMEKIKGNENIKNGILYNVEVHEDFNDKQYSVSFYVNNIKESMEHNKETYEDVIEDAKRMRYGISDNYIDIYDFNILYKNKTLSRPL